MSPLDHQTGWIYCRRSSITGHVCTRAPAYMLCTQCNNAYSRASRYPPTWRYGDPRPVATREKAKPVVGYICRVLSERFFIMLEWEFFVSLEAWHFHYTYVLVGIHMKRDQDAPCKWCNNTIYNPNLSTSGCR